MTDGLALFADHHYADPSRPLETNCARLALHIAIYLQRSLHVCNEGQTPRAADALRPICHALEALQELSPLAFATCVERGADWLVDLTSQPFASEEERNAVCLHPSRFKTLICLHRFHQPDIEEEFAALGRRVGSNGLLHDIISTKPHLASTIYCDCLSLVDRSRRGWRIWSQPYNAMLDAVSQFLTQWAEEHRRGWTRRRWMGCRGTWATRAMPTTYSSAAGGL